MVTSLKSEILENSFKTEKDKSFTEVFLVPDPKRIDKSSSLDKDSTPYISNLSLGLSNSGISFIFILSPIILLSITF